jgi:hypothetical protein
LPGELIRKYSFNLHLSRSRDLLQPPKRNALLLVFQPEEGGRGDPELPGELRIRSVSPLLPQEICKFEHPAAGESLTVA